MKVAKSQISSQQGPIALGASELVAVDGGGGEHARKPHQREKEPETLTVWDLPSGVQIHTHESDNYHVGNLKLGEEYLAAPFNAYESSMVEEALNGLGYPKHEIQR